MKKLDARTMVRGSLALLQVALLAFPPGIFATTDTAMTWIGGSDVYSNAAAWSCTSGCGMGVSTFPNNGNLGLNYDAIINNGGDVSLDVQAIINSMTIAGVSVGTLDANTGQPLTMGTNLTSGNALTISNGGVLNVSNGSNVTLDLSNGATGLNDTGGLISVTDAGTLLVQNTNNGSSLLTNNGTIAVTGTTAVAGLVFNGTNNNTFTLTGSGSVTLSGVADINGQTTSESLINDVNQTISGNGSINAFNNFTNNGTLHASISTPGVPLGNSLLVFNLTNFTNWNAGTNTLTGGTYIVDDGATLRLAAIGTGNSIQTLAGGAAVTINGTGLLTGDITGTTNALSGLANIDNSTLNLSGATMTITPTGGAFSLTNGANLNVNNSAALTLDLTSVGSSALNDATSQINVQSSGSLIVQDLTPGGAVSFTNNGTIGVTDIGSGTANLTFNDGGAGATFTLTGSGTLTLGGTGSIAGQSGDETLVNDVNHTIAGDGTITNLGSFTNNGTLHASTPNESLIVAASANFTNWNATANTLTGGSYVVDNGATLQLSSVGSVPFAVIPNIQGGASVTINLSGLLTGDGTTNSILGLTTINDSAVTLNGVTGAAGIITPGGGTLVLSSSAIDGQASLTIDQLSGVGSNVTIAGAFTNVASQNGFPGANTANTSTLLVNNGSTLTIQGAFLNQAMQANGPQNPSAIVNVYNGSTLNLQGGITTQTDAVAYSTITVDNSTLNVTGDFLQGGAAGSPTMSAGGDNLNLNNNAFATVHGNFQNNNGLNGSGVNLSNSSLSVDGTFSQTQANGGFGYSQLQLTNNSIATVGGLQNGSGVNGNGNQSNVFVMSGSSLTVRNPFGFANLDGTGLLSGGLYQIGSGASINYTGVDVNTIDYNTTLILDAEGTSGTTGQLINNLGVAHDAIANSLTEVDGTLTVQNSASLALTTPGGFSNYGTVNVLNGSTLDLTGTTFNNIDSSGTLLGGTFLISSKSALAYNGADLTDIGFHASLTLDNSPWTTGTGQLLNGTSLGTAHDAISNTLIEVDGTLTVQNRGSLTLTGAQGSFLNNGAINVLSNSTMDVSNTNFLSIGGGTLNSGYLYIGSGSKFIYNNGAGNDITTIGFGGGLTLDGSGELVNGFGGNHDAVANTLTTVYGYLGLLNGASLNLPLLTNVSGGVLSNTSLEIGNGSTLTYGNDQVINTIDYTASLTFDGNNPNGNGPVGTLHTGQLLSSAGGTPIDAISNSLTQINSSFGQQGALTLQNGATMALTASSFTNYGYLGVLSGSTLDLTGTDFSGNVTPGGTLTGGGTFEVGGNAKLLYNGPSDITAIGRDTQLILDAAVFQYTGAILNNGHDAISNSLNMINGNGELDLNGGAFLSLSNFLTNQGYIVLDNGAGSGNKL